MRTMSDIDKVGNYKNLVNVYLGTEIQDRLGLKIFQDLITAGRIEKLACRTETGKSLYKLNQ